MMLLVTKADMLTDDVRLIRFESQSAEPLPLPVAGDHVELRMQIANEYVRRQYSLVSSLEQEDYYEIAVKRHSAGRGGSDFLHDELTVGDVIDVSHPISGFELVKDGQHYILIAGGIGITPMMNIVSILNKIGASYELHYSSKTEKNMAFRAHFIEQNIDNVFLYITKENQPKRIEIDSVLGKHVNLNGLHVYVCGPDKLIESVRLAAKINGITRQNIHFESFGPNWELGDGVVKIELTESRFEFEVEPGMTLLEAMESAGTWISSDCKRGECGACITTYSGGEPIHRDHCLTEEQRKHSFCPCVSWASSNSVLKIQL